MAHPKPRKANLEREEKVNSLVIGLGEVGLSLYHHLVSFYPTNGRDVPEPTTAMDAAPYEIMHICFPYTEKFVSEVHQYQKTYAPKYTVIHSTVPVGTSIKCGAVHSPFRGKHYEMSKSLEGYTKLIGGYGSAPYVVANYFMRTGIRVMVFDGPETTELGKLLETTYFGVCVEFAKAAEVLCEKHQVPFHEAYTLYLQTLNEGIKRYGFNHPEMPIMTPIQGRIGGHCVLPNCDLVEFQFAELIKHLNKE